MHFINFFCYRLLDYFLKGVNHCWELGVQKCWNYKEFSGITWKSWKLQGILRNYKEFLGITKKSWELQKCSGNYVEVPGITRKSQEL